MEGVNVAEKEGECWLCRLGGVCVGRQTSNGFFSSIRLL